MDESRWGQPVQLSCTILIKNVTNFNETAIRRALEITEDVNVHRALPIGDEQVLIDFTTNTPDINVQSIRVGQFEYPIAETWSQYPDQPTIVCAKGLPHTITEDYLKTYLEVQDIDTENIVLSNEEGTANIELVNPRDLPYLLCTKHKIKKKPIQFVEASIAAPIVDEEYDDSVIMASFIQQNICDTVEPQALKVVCAVLKEDKDLFRESLAYQFKKEYYLTVEQFLIKDNAAYLTFTDEEGVSRVLEQPLTDFLGAPVEFYPVPLTEVDFSSKPLECSPTVLLIEDLPLDYTADMVKEYLELVFSLRGHKVIEFKLENGRAYFMFRDHTAVSELIKNPPDNSTLWGRPIRYTYAMDVVFPDTGPCVLVVDGLSTNFSGVNQALKVYLRNITEVKPLSCVVSGRQAFVKFQDDQVAKRLVQAPPTIPFLESTLTFTTRPDPHPIGHYQKSTASLKHQQSDPVTYTNVESPRSNSVHSSLPPIPTPRRKNRPRSSSLIVESIPRDYTDSHIRMCLEALTKEKCKNVKIKKQTALIEMEQPICVDNLQSKLAKEESFTGKPPTVNPLAPSNCILISAREKIDCIEIRFFCMKYCNGDRLIVKQKSSNECIVTFSTQEDLKQFENAERDHFIGTKILSVTSYHPVMASFEEDSDSSSEDVPPPIPPQHFNYPLQHTYQHVSYRLKMSKGKSNYMREQLSKMKKDLINIHADAFIDTDILEVRPLTLAKDMDDWEDRVREIVKQYEADFRSLSVPLNRSTKPAVIEYLYDLQQKYRDFSFRICDDEYELNGGSENVIEALEHINNMTTEEVEISREFKRPSHLIDYFMKFGAEEINSIHPPVTIVRNQTNPELVVIRGVSESIEKIEAIAKEKLSSVTTEYVPLTQSAHRLLSQPKGRKKLKNCLGSTLDVIYYTFEKTASREEYTHQVCITSSDASSLAVAKRIFDNLCREEKMPLQQEEVDLISTDGWDKLVQKFDNELFVSIRRSGDVMTITGNETDIKKVVREIRRFLNAQDETTEELQVSSPVWQVLFTQLNDKLDRVCKEASQNKVRLVLPTTYEEVDSVIIVMIGNMRYIDNVKVRLSHMVDEVLQRDVALPPMVGLHRIVEKGTLKAKCHELSRTNKVVIRFEIEADESLNGSFQNGGNGHSSRRIVSATCAGTGVRVSVYTGDYARQRCDAIVTFIPENPDFSEPVFMALGSIGGREVQNDLQATLGSQKLISASVYRTQYTGNMKCHALFHIVLPMIQLRNSDNLIFQQNALKTTLQKVLQQTGGNKYNTIVLCPLTVPPLNYPTELYAETLALIVSEIRSDSHASDMSIQVFVDNDCEGNDFEVALKKNNFQIHDHNPLEYVSILKPKVTKQLGNRDSLEKAVKITTGDMLDLQTDVYINSTGPEMDLSTGFLARQFKQKCGRTLINEIDDYLFHEGQLKYGKVAVTSAENLKSKAIYHIALKRTDQPGYERSFRESVENILLTAMDHGHKSIAIPCLGVTGLGYKPEFSARVLFDAVISFHYKHPTAITQFCFVVFRKSDETAFFDEYDTKILQFAKVTAAPSLNGSKPNFGALNVEIINGDLAKERTEVIVNSTSEMIEEDANQISRAIFAAAGDDMRYACRSLVSSGLRLVDGMVIPTNASGVLRCDKIYHVNVPGKLRRDVPPTKVEGSLLKMVVNGCLDLAENTKQETISFPAFCLGIGKYTVEQSGGLMFEAFDEFIKRSSPKYLRKIRIVICDKQLYDEFLQYYNRIINDHDPATPSIGSEIPLRASGPIGAHSLKPSIVNFPSKVLKKSAVSFHLYGIQKESLDDTERELKVFIHETIVTDMVDLEETMKLFHADDLKSFYELAIAQDIEVDVQPEFKRIILRGEENAVEKMCNKIQQKKFELQALTNELQIYQWCSTNSAGGGVKIYSLDVTMQIEVAFKRKLDSVSVTIDQTPIMIDLRKMEEYDNIGGVRGKVERRRKTMEIEFPREWCRQPCDSRGVPTIVHFETISEHNLEYTRATKRFQETLGNIRCTIVSVKRIQNPAEYSRYHSLKSSWESIYGRGVVTEKELFHGTKEDSLDPICSQGFNRIFAADNNAAHFGKGVYFALNSSYSAQDKYSAKDKNGHKHILVCTLLVGKYTRGLRTMKIAPSIADNPQVLYDTLVDKVDAPTIFVAMKDSQAYPRYLITFKRDN